MINPIKNSFNSTLVQLKTACEYINLAWYVFQFHTGSIKNLRFSASVAASFCFNSTLVQLKIIFYFFLAVKKLCFNSTLVQLKNRRVGRRRILQNSFQFHTGSIKKSPKIKLSSRRRRRFNSTLVQLKTAVAAPCCNCFVLFQFHTGSIKKIMENNYGICPSWFQFHTGSIKNQQFIAGVGHTSRVSIPHWFN